MNNKVLLVSLWGNYNYGNKLQSYALKTLIEKMGYSVVVAKHDEPAPRLRTKIKKNCSHDSWTERYCRTKKH